MVRSFTVLDGIGKSLDPRFDISEIAAPYARDLILEAKPQFAKLQQEFEKRLAKQVRIMCSLAPSDCRRRDMNQALLANAFDWVCTVLIIASRSVCLWLGTSFVTLTALLWTSAVHWTVLAHAQNRAVVNLFRGPNMIEDVATTMRRLEEGDLKLRVRALDSERALTRVMVMPLLKCEISLEQCPASRWCCSCEHHTMTAGTMGAEAPASACGARFSC